MLECYTRNEGRTTILVMEGTLDVATSPEAEKHLRSYLEEHGSMIHVDMSRVDFVDSRGLGVLISALRRARSQGGGLYVQAAAHPVKRLLQTCGLATVFTSPDVGAAETGGDDAPPKTKSTVAKSGQQPNAAKLNK